MFVLQSLFGDGTGRRDPPHLVAAALGRRLDGNVREIQAQSEEDHEAEWRDSLCLKVDESKRYQPSTAGQ
jgi:hypothetical protein